MGLSQKGSPLIPTGTSFVNKVPLDLYAVIMQRKRRVLKSCQFAIKDQWSEAHHRHQNLVEGCAIKWLKSAAHVLLDRTGAPESAWYFTSI